MFLHIACGGGARFGPHHTNATLEVALAVALAALAVVVTLEEALTVILAALAVPLTVALAALAALAQTRH